ncbi:MAG: DegT/DnrJ/EryC1/StrS family aminotransferase [Myxococcota bacterium]
MTTIPFAALDREFAETKEAQLAQFETTLSHGRVLQGPEVTALEEKVAGLVGRRHAVAVGSCTDGLFFGLRAAGVGPGDEVLVTALSFVASASSIVRAGATPVFCDIDDHCNLDLVDAAARITERTKAIVYVHLYGQMGDPTAIEAFANAHNLILMEDAAQAFGASRDGRPAGSLGAVSAFSFDPTKVIDAPGSGGMVLTDDDAIGARLRRLRYHGKSKAGTFDELGYNSQMPSLTAGLLGLKVDLDASWRQRRQTVAARYDDELPTELQRIAPAGGVHAQHKYVLRMDATRRDAFREALSADGVQTRVHYARILPDEPLLEAYRGAPTPRAASVSASAVSLPIHPFLRGDEVDRVVGAARRFFA